MPTLLLTLKVWAGLEHFLQGSARSARDLSASMALHIIMGSAWTASEFGACMQTLTTEDREHRVLAPEDMATPLLLTHNEQWYRPCPGLPWG